MLGFPDFLRSEQAPFRDDVWLEKFAPHEPVRKYRHKDTGEDNADAHLERQVPGREVWWR